MIGIANDYTVFDGLHTVTWYRPVSGFKVCIPSALCLKETQNFASTESNVAKTVATWQFPKIDLPDEIPILGDVFIDRCGKRYYITEIENLNALGCWKCTGVDFASHFGQTETVDIYRPVWSQNENGVPTAEYRLFRPEMPAKIVPSATGTGSTANVEIHIAAPGLELRPYDRLDTPTERIFRVVKFQPAKNWSEVSRIFCMELPQR